MKEPIDNIINWDQAQKVNKRITKEQKEEQQRQIDLFFEENHELADGRDLQHWIDVTGKDLEWVLENAPGLDETLYSILTCGGTLDDVWDYKPPIIDFDCDEEEEESHTEILKLFKI